MNQTELTMKTAILTLSIIGTLIAHVTAQFNLRTLIGGDLTQNGKDCFNKIQLEFRNIQNLSIKFLSLVAIG